VFRLAERRDESILDWVKKNYPGYTESVVEGVLLSSDEKKGWPGSKNLYIMLVIGFEAGRQFQHDNPTLEINNPDVYSDTNVYWKVGDKIVRIFSSSHDVNGRIISEETRFDGEIIEVKEKTVVAAVQVDIMRDMEFFKDTGISVLGKDFGRIVHAGQAEGK